MKMISKLNIFIMLGMFSTMFAIEDPYGVCAAGSELEDTYGVMNAAVTVTWSDDNPFEGCGADEVEDCDGTGECWPATWVGDGYPDCEDQQWGADLTCYDCDGGDCPESDPGCGGDGTTGGTTGGATTGGTTGGSDDCAECEFDWTNYGSECCDTAWVEYGIDCATLAENYNWDCSGCNCPGDAAGGNGGNGDVSDILPVSDRVTVENSAYFRDMQDHTSDRSIVAIVTYSCDACLDGGPWSGFWETATGTGATGFTVYGFDYGAEVCASVALSSNISGETSETIEAGCVIAGDADTISCSDGTGGCDTAGTGDVNADGATNVLDIVSIVNVILGGEFADECAALSADLNGDGEANVLDIVAIVNIILGGARTTDATSVELIKDSNSLSLRADGYIGGVQMTLSHSSDFILNLTKDAMVSDYSTEGTTTTLVVVKPESNELFTANSDFVIKDMIIANSQGAMDVSYAPQSISLSKAYPNPFNPSTTIDVNLHQDGFTSVKVYNLMGHQVAVLAEGYMSANTYSLTWDAKDIPSGLYMVRAEAAGNIATEKLMLLK